MASVILDHQYLLMAGGYSSGLVPISTSHILNMTTGIWITSPSLNLARSNAECRVVGQTFYVLSGGHLSIEILDVSDISNILSKSWVTLNVTLPRTWFNTVVYDSDIVLLGGNGGDTSIYALDTLTNTLRYAGEMLVGRHRGLPAVIGQAIYFWGGIGSTGCEYLASPSIITPDPTKSPTLNPSADPTPSPTDVPDEYLINKYNMTFEYVSNEDYNGVPMTIGWIKYAHCIEGDGSPLIFDDPNYINDILKYAITVKILPTGNIPGVNENVNFSVKADICSNPVFALNHGYEFSFKLDLLTELIIDDSVYTDWIGSQIAQDRMRNNRSGISSNIPSSGSPPGYNSARLFWARDNVNGLHITGNCRWDTTKTFNQDITIWIGFHIFGTKWCTLQSNPTQYTLTSGLSKHT